MDLPEKLARIELGQYLSPRQTLSAIELLGCGVKALAELSNHNRFQSIKYNSVIKSVDLDTVIVYGEADYPKLLTEIPDPPITLYFKGDKKILNSELKMLSLVGTRKVSNYGTQIAAKLSKEAVEYGVVTVSGLAFGVDKVIHEQTLNYQGKTLAVLGTGINQPYPKSNCYLYDRIINEGGVVVSEFQNSQGYDKWIFPRRNRIIAGISEATIVVEAPSRSGALLTANLASGYNRRVFAVPGSILSDSMQGNLDLLQRQQAEIIRDIKDVFPELSSELLVKEQNLKTLGSDQQQFLKTAVIQTDLLKIQQVLKWEEVKLMKVTGELEIMGLISLNKGRVGLIK